MQTNVSIKFTKTPYSSIKKQKIETIVKPSAGKVVVEPVDIYFLLSGGKMALCLKIHKSFMPFNSEIYFWKFILR